MQMSSSARPSFQAAFSIAYIVFKTHKVSTMECVWWRPMLSLRLLLLSGP